MSVTSFPLLPAPQMVSIFLLGASFTTVKDVTKLGSPPPLCKRVRIKPNTQRDKERRAPHLFVFLRRSRVIINTNSKKGHRITQWNTLPGTNFISFAEGIKLHALLIYLLWCSIFFSGMLIMRYALIIYIQYILCNAR